MQSSPFKGYNKVYPAAPWKADGTEMTHSLGVFEPACGAMPKVHWCHICHVPQL